VGGLIERGDAWFVALGFTVAMLAAWGVGLWVERRWPTDPARDAGTKFTDASMALLGLLLGFTFAMSLTRHEHRRAAVVAESNAIGDFYTCASLLKGQERTRLQTVVREYAVQKLAVTRGPLSEQKVNRAVRDFQSQHARMTAIVSDALTVGTPIAVSLTNTLNGVTSTSASRLAAYHDRLPGSIVLLLLLSSTVPAFLMGKQQGFAQKVHLTGTLSFVIVVSMVIYVTLDLNQPGTGAIIVSQEPMERLIQSMSP
jgi:hypothetical protein